MARNAKIARSTIKNYRKIDYKQGVLFLYGKLDMKSRAIGYCELHKCYLDNANVSEKRCFKKHCKYYKEVN